MSHEPWAVPPDELRRFTYDEWLAEGKRLFGDTPSNWAWVCPNCRTVITLADYKAAGTKADQIAFQCIGRFVSGGGCDYHACGLVCLAPTIVVKDGREMHAFAFAPPPVRESTCPT